MNLSNYIILFFLYSFIGWIIEVINVYYEERKFINRGFLIGPLCPIYGVGCLLIVLLLKKYTAEPFVLFIMAIVICSILEYFTSYFMEKIFKARWWDYSHRKFNINGRICLETMLPFGIMGCLMLYYVNPFCVNILNSINNVFLNIVATILSVLFIVDFSISFKIINSFKNTVSKIQKDSTVEITKKVKEVLLSGNILKRRLINAFPRLETIKLKIKRIGNKKERL